MSEFTDLLLQTTSPVTAVLLVGLGLLNVLQTRYFREKIEDVRKDVDNVRRRAKRVEDHLLATDGGEEDGS